MIERIPFVGLQNKKYENAPNDFYSNGSRLISGGTRERLFYLSFFYFSRIIIINAKIFH